MKVFVLFIVLAGSFQFLLRSLLRGSVARKPSDEPKIEIWFTYADIDGDGNPIPRSTVRVPDSEVWRYFPSEVREQLPQKYRQP